LCCTFLLEILKALLFKEWCFFDLSELTIMIKIFFGIKEIIKILYVRQIIDCHK